VSGVLLPSARDDLLTLVRATKRFPLRHGLGHAQMMTAVDDVTLAVRAARTLALVGESGSGKSTIGRLLLGLLEPDDGQVSFRGEQIRTLPRARRDDFRRSVQIVFQNPFRAFSPMLTLGGSIRDALRLRRLPKAAQAAEVASLLGRVHLPADIAGRYPTEVSGGQLQRVSIARALAPGPEALFLDEPTSALDVSLRGQIVNLLLEIQAEHELGYLVVSHDLRLVEAMAHDVVVMYLGHVMEEGPAEIILADPVHPYTLALLASAHAKRVGDKGEHPSSLRGEVVPLPSDYRGCKLIHRCPFAQPACQQPQELREFAGRLVRCRRAEEVKGIVAGLLFEEQHARGSSPESAPSATKSITKEGGDGDA
jgi:oligopeptide transport system ATP-binding protein